ncbi:MAG: glycosyltransferase [Pseudomonadota bacterium]|nr:glycosyltransferase [Pseudomonadota bacterium]
MHLISGPLTGGASLGALNLHRGLLECDINSVILSNDKHAARSSDIIVRGYFKDRLTKAVSNLPLRFFFDRKPGSFNTGFGNYNLAKKIEEFEIDVLHVHWANGMIGLHDLAMTTLPTLITLRDMWYFTGGCHYPIQCEKYKNVCDSCPHLCNLKKTKITRKTQDIKKKVIEKENISIVAISPWLQRKASQSQVMENKKIHYIPNSVDIHNFSFHERLEARNLLGLPIKKNMILLGAQSIKSDYKGASLLPEIFSKLDQSKEKTVLVTFGKQPVNYKFQNIAYYHLGFISERKKLNLLYSAADVFLMPSVIEAFGKTIVEALASGTPVCLFDDTGGAALIRHKKNGYVAKNQDTDDMIKGVNYILNNIQMEDALTLRQMLHDEYNTTSTAKKYIQLYREITNTNYNG